MAAGIEQNNKGTFTFDNTGDFRIRINAIILIIVRSFQARAIVIKHSVDSPEALERHFCHRTRQ